MPPSRPLTDDERTFLHVTKAVAKKLRLESVTLGWEPTEGLVAFDAAGGNRPQTMVIPGGVTTLPTLDVVTERSEVVFLSMRWSAARVTRWVRIGELGIDSASVCVGPEALLRVDAERYRALEDALRGAERAEAWAWADVGGGPGPVDRPHGRRRPRSLRGAGRRRERGGLGARHRASRSRLGGRPAHGPDVRAAAGPWLRQARPALRRGRAAGPHVHLRRGRPRGRPERQESGPRPPELGWRGGGLVRIKKVEAADFHIPRPICLFRVLPRYPGNAVPKADRDAMLQVAARLAMSCRGALFHGAEGEELTVVDFGA